MREAIEESKRRNGWMARQRHQSEWFAWHEWRNCTHELEKQAVERRWGEILRSVLEKRLRVSKRQQAYCKALSKANNHAERCQAVELLEEGEP